MIDCFDIFDGVVVIDFDCLFLGVWFGFCWCDGDCFGFISLKYNEYMIYLKNILNICIGVGEFCFDIVWVVCIKVIDDDWFEFVDVGSWFEVLGSGSWVLVECDKRCDLWIGKGLMDNFSFYEICWFGDGEFYDDKFGCGDDEIVWCCFVRWEIMEEFCCL